MGTFSYGRQRSVVSVLLAVLMVAVAVPLGLVVRPATAEAAGPPGFFECTPGTAAPVTCPNTVGVFNNNGPFLGTDDSVGVFVGGNMTVQGSSAESEGLLVVLGDLSINKDSGSNRYDVGEAGVGSRITPSPGTDFLLVGGDISVNAGLLLSVGGLRQGVVRHAGTATGTVEAGSSASQDANAVSAYTGIPAILSTLSTCLANETATGTATGGPSNITFTGDGSSAIQIFDYPDSITGFGGNGNGGFAFADIPAGASVIVNMTNPGALSINTFTGASGGVLGSGVTREQVLFNVPNATTVNLGGQPQFQGSLLVGNPTSVTTNMWSGIDGRLYTAGDLIHDGNGNEHHSYPFTGTFPAACEGTPPTPGNITIIKNTVPAIDQEFSFTTMGLAQPNFVLNDDGTGTSDRQEFTDVAAGTYTVTEVADPGYVTTAVCDDTDSTILDATATIVVAEGETVTCTYTNTAVIPATIDIEKATNGVDADLAAEAVEIEEGMTVTWSYVVTHTGAVGAGDITGIAVADNLEGAVTCPLATLTQGQSMTCTPITGVAIEGAYTNTAVVTGDDPNDVEVRDEDPSNYVGTAALTPTIDIEKATNGVDADLPASAVVVPTGSTVTWSYVVTHTGEVGSDDLDNIVVADDLEGAVTCPLGTLSQGQSMTCTAIVGTAVEGAYTNTAVVTGDDPNDVEVRDEDPSNYVAVTPSIDIEKATNGIDADAAVDAVAVALGSTVTWSYVVTHTGADGSGDIDNIDVQDDVEGQVTCPETVLSPGESMMCTALSGTATAGLYMNTATVTGDDVNADELTDDDPSHYVGVVMADIEIEKATNGVDADLPAEAVAVAVGSTVSWSYVVTHTGAVGSGDITDITVADDMEGMVTCPQTTLAQGESMTCTALTGIAAAGPYANTATVTGIDPNDGDAPRDDDDPSHYVGETPGIDIEKATNGEDADLPADAVVVPTGSTVTWTYVVTHTGAPGSGDITDITVTDDIEGAVTCPQTTLTPGESMTCAALTGIATEGGYTNTATVEGVDVNDEPVDDEDPSNYEAVTPSIDIEKATNGIDADTAPEGPELPVGADVTWSYVVTHTGAVGSGDITNLVVIDDLEGEVTCPQTTLSPGGSMTCTPLSGTVAAGPYVNSATVTGDDPNDNEIGDDDPSNHTGIEAATLEIEKATNGVDADTPAEAVLVTPGDPVTWSYVVTHTGPADSGDVTDIAVTDDIEGAVTCPRTTLAQGESMICTAIAGVAVDGPYVNTATVTGLDRFDEDVEDDDPSNYLATIYDLATTIEFAPVAPTSPLAIGDEVTYLVEVRNQGTEASGDYSFVVTLGQGLAYVSDTADIALNSADNGDGTVTFTVAAVDGLAIGETVSFDVVATVDDNRLELYRADVEITADGGDDKDSSPDPAAGDTSNDAATAWGQDDAATNHNDVTTDLDGIGDAFDDHDAETFPNEPVYDLAATIEFATTAPTSPLAIGDEVTYLVEVRNQGTVVSEDYSFVVTLDEGLAYVSDTADVALTSVDNGDGTVTFTVAAADGLDPLETVSFELVASVDDNRLELYRADVEIVADGGAIDDKDSSPDPAAGDTNNDGATDWGQDDAATNHNDVTTDLDGIGDAFDDHDAETFPNEPVYDLATTIEFATGAPTSPVMTGDEVTYLVEVRNQGTVVSEDYSFVVTLDEGLAYVSDTADVALNSVDNGDGTVTFTVAAADGLDPLETVSFELVAEIGDPIQTVYRADVEIVADGGVIDDKDSSPDPAAGDTSNDAATDWGQDDAATNHNDVTTDLDGIGDAFDDHDAETFLNEPVYDLATTIAFTDGAPVAPVAIGAEVSYTVDLANQGTVVSGGFITVVTVPEGMSYVSDNAPDGVTVTDNGDNTVTYQVGTESELDPVEVLSFEMVTTIDDNTLTMYRIDVEITADSGDIDDKDSVPGSVDTGNDATTWDQDDPATNHNDSSIDVDGPGDAFDDHDAEKFINTPIYDLATTIEFAAGAPTSPLAVDAAVVYSVEIRNQGSITSGEFAAVITVPESMSYVSDTSGSDVSVADNGDGTITVTVPEASELSPEQSLVFEVVTNVDDHLQTMYRVDIEITADSGEDIDSDPTTGDAGSDATTWDQDSAVTNHNDALTDVDGPGDAFDDHDAEKFSNTPVRYTLSGFVRLDTNSQDVSDPNNRPISGVVVRLTSDDESFEPVTTTTDEAGFYMFANLLPGTYTVTEVQPAGFRSANDIDGVDDNVIQTVQIVDTDIVNQDFLEDLQQPSLPPLPAPATEAPPAVPPAPVVAPPDEAVPTVLALTGASSAELARLAALLVAIGISLTLGERRRRCLGGRSQPPV